MPRVYAYAEEGYKISAEKSGVSWRNMNRHQRRGYLVPRVLAVAVVSFLGINKAADTPLNVIGNFGRTRSAKEVDAIAAQERANIFKQDMTPSQRFNIQYLDDAHKFGDIKVNKGVESSGLLALPAAAKLAKYYLIGQSCLRGTAYDTSPSAIRGNSVEGISAAAAINLDENGIVSVVPAADQAVILHFDIDQGGVLRPHDSATQRTLAANSCSTPLVA